MVFATFAATALADTAAGLRAFRDGHYGTAYRECKAAAEQGQAEAQRNRGVLYAKGLGVRRDLTEAMR